MSAMLNKELEWFGKALKRWRIQLQLLRGVAGLLIALCLFAMLDLWFQLGGPGRWLSALLLFTAIAGLATWTLTQWRRRWTTEGLATVIERAFPELDNHLINYIQFARDADKDPFKTAYVRSGSPSLESLDTARLKNPRAYRQSWMALGVAMAVLVFPSFIWGAHWTTALWRTMNPLSDAVPPSLTRILSVEPGDADLPQGRPLLLQTRIQGEPGHTVRVEIDPDDARSTLYEIGSLTAQDEQVFSYRVPRVNTRFRYRIRAGDAPPSPWYTVTPRPPPAFQSVSWRIEPPPYTRLPPYPHDALNNGAARIPAGSRIVVRAETLATLQELQAVVPGDDPVPLQSVGEDGKRWQGLVTVNQTGQLVLEAIDPFDQTLRETLPYTLEPDQPPIIEVLSPEGRTVLQTGQTPVITFQVRDDHGLNEVFIEQVTPNARGEEDAVVVQRWAADNAASMNQRWEGNRPGRQATVMYRIIAVDNAPEEPQISHSGLVVFAAPDASEAAEARADFEEQARTGLHRVIELQKANLEKSRQLQSAPGEPHEEPWRENENRQREIRELTRALLRNPLSPLGARAESVGRLYANEMTLAVDALSRLPGENVARRPMHIQEVVRLQSAILRQLQVTEAAAAESRRDRHLSGLAAQLETLIRGQARIVAEVERYTEAQSAPPRALADTQDELAEDVADFQRACEREASADAAFAELMNRLIQETRTRRIREDMLMSAERIEQQQAGQAAPLAGRAHGNLQHLLALLEQVRLQRDEEQYHAMAEGLSQARATLDRLSEMHQAIRETMDGVRGQLDKDEEFFDVFLEEYMELARRNRESLLTIPADLHVFTDLNVGNELVEDIYSVYEEIEQVAGSEDYGEEMAAEWLFVKNDVLIENMIEIEGRLDDMERWLPDSPTPIAARTETLDLEEMPESGVALATLATALESLISDLLDVSEEMERASENAATTWAMADSAEYQHDEDPGELPDRDRGDHQAPPEDEVFGPMPVEFGWEVMEGEYSSYAAKGEAGNERPDHHEQDGRSTVGREGMASGETAAGSGTMQEGDPNIEARRTEDPTQSGMVQLEGEANTAATGGGKLASGKADDVGMTGGIKRMDSTEEGSAEGMEALLARHAEDIYAQATMQNIRVDSLQAAVHHLRHADDAVAKGDIFQLREHRRTALAELQRARMQLDAQPEGMIDLDAAPQIIRDAVQAGPDQAPAQFRTQVAEYFKLLNEMF